MRFCALMQVHEQLTGLALFLSEPPTSVEREPEYLFNAIWRFAVEFDRALTQVIKCCGQHS
jgi:hypothetical protein